MEHNLSVSNNLFHVYGLHRYSEEPATEETALLSGIKSPVADPVASSQADAQPALTEVFL